ncbi:cbb3-type cytochrome oxidase assembly protein CcoS [Altererythrobacter sp. Z27]|uniref:cbb3-type cytochrome oxidase assembly protein CcoS n=1 Tax=Altererythrobacter sp. Z27 TaxID=3461147 RepID=UPI0040449402
MNGLMLLIPVALGMGAIGLAMFFWAMRDGQFEDLDGAAQRILIDDDEEDEQC